MLPVVNETTEEFEFIDQKDVLYIIVRKHDHVYYHTHRGVFRRIKGVEEYEKAFAKDGFSIVDRNIIAQVELATRYDPLLRLAYFDHPDYKSQACQVTKEVGEYLDAKLNKKNLT